MKSFKDSKGQLLWVNKTGWATEDLQALVELALKSIEPPTGVYMRFNSKIITFVETEGDIGGRRFRGADHKEDPPKVVRGLSWNDGTIAILKRSKWFSNPVEEMANAADCSVPRFVVEQLFQAIVLAVHTRPMSSEESVDKSELNELTLRRKSNRLEEGEEEPPNVLLRLRSLRQSRIGRNRAWKSKKHLWKFLYIASRFEKNGVECQMSEEDLATLERAMVILAQMEQALSQEVERIKDKMKEAL